MLKPLLCCACDAPLAVSESASVACSYCGADNSVPDEYREALRAARDLDDATRLAAAAWLRLRRIRVPRWAAFATALLPFSLIAGGLLTSLAVVVIAPSGRGIIPRLVGFAICLPMLPLTYVATRTGLRNLLTSGAALIADAFASRPPASPGAPNTCRQCGAPLSIRPDDVLVRCLYCGVESIVALDVDRRARLAVGVATARASLADAMKAITDRAALVALQTRGRLAVVAVLLGPLLLWCFAGEPIQTSWWSLAISLDVWVLSVCLFWYIREAMLPPVAIEALQSVLGGGADPAPEAARAPKTRGWYDHAFDAINFAVPAAVAVVFLLLQIAVLLEAREHG